MNCEMCKEGPCCPTHCCNWDTCKCGDCEQCEAPSTRRDSTTSTTSSVASSASVPPSVVPDSAAKRVPDRGYKAPSEVFETLQQIEDRVRAKMQLQKEEEAARRKVEEDQRAAERKKYQDVLQSTKDFLESNKQTISQTQETMKRLQGTLEGIKDTEKKFQQFQAAYDKLFLDCLNNVMGGDTEPVESLREKYGAPRGCVLEEAAFRLSECKKIVVIVGAGVSVESGVPTYKDNDEKWEIDGDMLSHEEMATSRIMTSCPYEFWLKQHLTKRNMLQCRPNGTHFAIAELYNFWRHIGRSACVITQNIDNYDREVLGPDADLYEVHGNLEYMRCMTDCCDVLFPAPDAREDLERIPMCPACEGLARPHILLFDESYCENLYGSDTAVQRGLEADCVLVLGTQLKTGLANKVVTSACRRPDTLVIEVNVEPVLTHGQVLVLTNSCGEVVPQLVGMAIQQAR